MGGFVDRLHGVAFEQAVSPGDQVVQIGHDGHAHEGDNSEAGNGKGLEWMLFPLLDHRIEADGIVLVNAFQLRIEVLLRISPHLGIVEGLYLPVLLQPDALLLGGVENVVQPVLGLIVFAVLHQPRGDHHRDVEKQFPIVLAVSRSV